MSDVAERVKKIVIERLGVDASKVTDDASFGGDLASVSTRKCKELCLCDARGRPDLTDMMLQAVGRGSFESCMKPFGAADLPGVQGAARPQELI
jgi:hypothetical protein